MSRDLAHVVRNRIVLSMAALENQSIDSTGGSIISECRLGKWS